MLFRPWTSGPSSPVSSHSTNKKSACDGQVRTRHQETHLPFPSCLTSEHTLPSKDFNIKSIQGVSADTIAMDGFLTGEEMLNRNAHSITAHFPTESLDKTFPDLLKTPESRTLTVTAAISTILGTMPPVVPLALQFCCESNPSFTMELNPKLRQLILWRDRIKMRTN